MKAEAASFKKLEAEAEALHAEAIKTHSFHITGYKAYFLKDDLFLSTGKKKRCLIMGVVL